MKQKQKPLSFSMHPDNIAYIEAAVQKQKEVNHRYSRSMYIDDLITHLRLKAKPSKSKQEVVIAKPATKRFKAPTVEEVSIYCNQRCNNVDAQGFVDHYEANGWMRGKAKIKNWKSCVHTWEKNSTTQTRATGKTANNFSECEDFING